jgi:hypothetical protein
VKAEHITPEAADATRRDGGQILVIFAVASVAFVLLLALTIDVGYGFFQRREAQNVSDLAALAGAQVIGQSELDLGKHGATSLRDTDVVTAVDHVVQQNVGTCVRGVSSSPSVPCGYLASYVDKNRQPIAGYGSGGTIPSAARGVQVTTSRAWRAFFAGVAGMPDWAAAATAKAMAVQRVNVAAAGQLLPIALWQDFRFDSRGLLQVTEDTRAAPGPGNFGWIDWSNTANNSAADLAASVCAPSNPPHVLPWTVDGDTGKGNSSEMRGCLDAYIANGSVVILPIYGLAGCTTPGSGNGCGGQTFWYTLTGYAAVRLVSYDHQGITWLKAQLIDFINPAGVLPTGSDVSDVPMTTPVYFGLVE